MIGDQIYRGKKLGLETTHAMCKFGFEVLKLNEIVLKVLVNNNKAKAIYESCGFRVIEIETYKNIQLEVMSLNSLNYKVVE
ncbi:hypothetical protein D3C86_2016330 [compost metagenome]